MGLHLNFELRLPPNTSRADALSLLNRLRDAAASTDVEHVSLVVDLARGRESVPEDDAGRPWRVIHFYAECFADPAPDDELPRYTGDPYSAIGFVVDPGARSETATFGLMRRRMEGATADEWFWWCGCKTQYASVVSNEHLVKVHTALVAILDAAVAIGFDVVVRDETGYWESRSPEKLIEEVTKMNRIVARIAGAMSDAIGDEHDVRGSIFEHRSFERLEMEE